VIRSGNPANPPVLLLPAEQQAAWSWIYNIVNLNKNFCTYAIDNIGDVGRSGLSDLRLFPQEDQEISDYLSEILDGIGLEKAIIMGASLGGQMAISLAKEEPERVDRLILLAPWGFSSPHKVINDRLMIRIFRFDSFVNRHRRSVTGSAGVVVNLIDEWLYNALKYSAPAMVSPRIFLSSELEEIEMPVLMILAGNDGILGEPENVKALADNIPDIEIHILESGHLINIERSGDVNKLVNMFLSDSEGGQN
jgi:pimeloyl-ACP methyl ester carboxylesterase